MTATPTSTPAGPRPVSGDSWGRRAGRALLRPFRPVDEVSEAITVARGLQRSSATGRRLVVEHLHGAESAAVTALMARALAHYRWDRVLAVGASPAEPSLAQRLGTDAPGTLGSGLDTASFEAAEKSIGRAGNRLWTVNTDPDDGEAHLRGLLPLSRFFGVTLVEGPRESTFVTAARAQAHARVLVARSTREGARAVGRVLDEADGSGASGTGGRDEELARTVVLLCEEERAEDPGFDADRTARIIAGSGAGVLRLAHDRHVAQGISVRTRRIREATQSTVLETAAQALACAIDGRARQDGEGRQEHAL
ncbi:hypothetical protein [Nocardiopsis xinjiangensis]|uniref:hypothetical protein n=1 Tax=Nocardiopsis xinjiangensis TaxID=124285 RepID=UPI000346DEC2|nr:hypothetical protein [Nocardiopsis xinjiangensis]